MDRRTVLADYPADAPGNADRARQIGLMYWIGRRIDYVPRGLMIFTVVVGSVLLLQGIALLPSRSPRSLEWALGIDPAVAGLVAWGVFLTGSLLVGLLSLAVAAYRTPLMRRGVGVLWDLSCFWPQDVHPFAPPCYNERVIPEVRARIRYHLGQAPRVILAGHSQGSVIAAVVALLERDRGRLTLVTFGCVLARLYSRFYPRYFSPNMYTHLVDDLRDDAGRPQWVNLWRRTDYLGGSVPYPPESAGDGPYQLRFTDPRFSPAPGDIVDPKPGRHSGFWLDPEYQEVMGRLAAGG